MNNSPYRRPLRIW